MELALSHQHRVSPPNAKRTARRALITFALSILFSASESIRAFPPPPPPDEEPPPVEPDCLDDVTGTLALTPSVIPIGGTSTMTWRGTVPSGCLAVKFNIIGEGGPGAVARTGSQVVSPPNSPNFFRANGGYWLQATRKIGGLTRKRIVAMGGLRMEETNYAANGLHECTIDQARMHDRVQNEQQSIDAIDPEGNFISWQEADGNFTRNWVPIDQYKHVLCGERHHVDFYIAPDIADGYERDTNVFVTPFSSSFYFQNFVNLPFDAGISDPDEQHLCDGRRCMEAEITLNPAYVNSAFPHVQASYWAPPGITHCAYGPWVADHGHGARAEIHPAETSWWNIIPTPNGLIREAHVLLALDDSSRYSDREDDYVPDLPANIRPWAESPHAAYVRYAFRLTPSGSPEYLHIWPGLSEGVSTATSGYQSDADDAVNGLVHTLSIDGQPRFTVLEHNNDDQLGVEFDNNLLAHHELNDVCRRVDGTIQGYVTLKSQLTRSRFNQEWWSWETSGFQELRLRHSYSLIDQPIAFAANAKGAARTRSQSRISSTRSDIFSLRIESDNTKTRLVGDMIVDLAPGAAILSASVGRENSLALAPADSSAKSTRNRVRLGGIDFSRGGPLRITLRDGETMTSDLPGMGIAIGISARPEVGVRSGPDLDAAWRSLLKAVGAEAVARPARFAAVAKWRVSAAPAFSALRSGKVSEEDELEVAEKLNRALFGDSELSATILLRAIKSLRWQDGEDVKESPTELSYVAEFRDGRESSVRVLTAKLSDVFGHEVSRRVKLHSHGIFDLTSTEMPPLIAALSGVDAGRLEPTNRKNPDSISEPFALERNVLNTLFLRSTQDGVVTPDELQAQITLARRIGAGVK